MTPQEIVNSRPNMLLASMQLADFARLAAALHDAQQIDTVICFRRAWVGSVVGAVGRLDSFENLEELEYILRKWKRNEQ